MEETSGAKNSYCDYAFPISSSDSLYPTPYCLGCTLKKDLFNVKVGKFYTLEGLCCAMEVEFEPAGVKEKGVRVNLSFNGEKTPYCQDNPAVIKGN
jgi:hypothetical protein